MPNPSLAAAAASSLCSGSTSSLTASRQSNVPPVKAHISSSPYFVQTQERSRKGFESPRLLYLPSSISMLPVGAGHTVLDASSNEDIRSDMSTSRPTKSAWCVAQPSMAWTVTPSRGALPSGLLSPSTSGRRLLSPVRVSPVPPAVAEERRDAAHCLLSIHEQLLQQSNILHQANRQVLRFAERCGSQTQRHMNEAPTRHQGHSLAAELDTSVSMASTATRTPLSPMSPCKNQAADSHGATQGEPLGLSSVAAAALSHGHYLESMWTRSLSLSERHASAHDEATAGGTLEHLRSADVLTGSRSPDPFQGLHLTPMCDRPFQAISSISRKAQSALVDRLISQVVR